MLHGVTFGLSVASLTTYVYDAAPKEASGTMIGLLSAFMPEIGAGIASLVGGYIYDEYGVRTMWKIGAFGLVPVTLFLVAIFAWLARRHDVSAGELERYLVEEVDSSSEQNTVSPIQ
ncbi:unnamed protein product [Phytophthora lilii]|uniref:Unnamed protein product n=1 Tax=Phytophthora lilii TaxID=2077276 RepID=A0A9W7CL14_9STRA|nr:unnamed protein product [Phytophthora lilii]